MLNEKGGRADKEGNEYEKMAVIYYMLKIFNDDEQYIIWEAIGEDEKGTDILIGTKNNIKKHIQCKISNGNKNYWTVNDLKKILNKWKDIFNNSNDELILFSPIPVDKEFKSLIDRSKNNDILIDFYKYRVLSNKNIKKNFDSFCELFNINIKKFDLEDNSKEKIEELNKSVNYLRKLSFCIRDEDILKEKILMYIEKFFIGDKEEIYYLLTGTLTKSLFGKCLYKNNIEEILKKVNIKFKSSALDGTTYEIIKDLNNKYNEVFKPINKKLFYRKEFDEVKEFLKADKSIVIYGKSGSGKSGVTQYIVDYCKENDISYLAIKLDKNTPTNTLSLWCEKELGLKKSLVYCIDEIASNNKGVIILDQLDALRWTNADSEDSINVCSKIIEQVINVNEDRKFKGKPEISIVFCCRKYDLYNDKNISSLINKESELKFEKLEVNLLSDEEVQKIIGNVYLNFNPKFNRN